MNFRLTVGLVVFIMTIIEFLGGSRDGWGRGEEENTNIHTEREIQTRMHLRI